MIEEVGAIVHYLPPYSPEMAFSKVKTPLKMDRIEEMAKWR